MNHGKSMSERINNATKSIIVKDLDYNNGEHSLNNGVINEINTINDGDNIKIVLVFDYTNTKNSIEELQLINEFILFYAKNEQKIKRDLKYYLPIQIYRMLSDSFGPCFPFSFGKSKIKPTVLLFNQKLVPVIKLELLLIENDK